ncbi:MAG TPA: GNAT family N-acetyltransferase [Actinophytocola sp.]|nr:GNAT family N-acetyltransferase [Actinophytocola sp.]
MITVDVLDPATDREPADWAAFVAARRLYAPWDYGLLAIESAGGQHPVLLVPVRRDGVLVAAVTAVVVRRGRGPRWLEVFHQWISGEPGWTFAGDVDPLERKEILRTVERALCRHVGLTCLGVVYRHVPPADVPLVSGFGRYVRATFGTAVLENTFTHTAGWLASLSRNRRSSLRKLRRKLTEDADLEVRCATARTDLDPVELAGLLRAHRGKFTSYRHDSRGPVTAEYLAALVARPDVWTISYHGAGGRLLAFHDLLDHPAHPLSQHWATRPADDGWHQDLFFDLYVRMVDHVIEQGAKTLSVGRGLDEVKTRLGCRMLPLNLAVVPRVVAG